MPTFFLFLTALLLFIHPAFPQRVSLDVREKPLPDVLERIQEQTGYGYILGGEVSRLSLPVTVCFRDLPIAEALRRVFRHQPVHYLLEGRFIRVRPGAPTRQQAPDGAPGGHPARRTPPRSAPELFADTLQEVVVHLATGYTRRPPAQVTGTMDHIDSALFHRRPGAGVLQRLENLAPGLLFNHGDAIHTDAMLLRGRSTLFADARPLVVLNQFPLDGDLSSIHPQDIAAVTLLKDAAAASIWGARAANGVIVISTRNGNGRPSPGTLSFGSYVGIQAKPDLSHVPTISPADFIALEQQLFQAGYYDRQEKSDPHYQGHPPFTPVVETLIARRDGVISPAEAAGRIETFQQQDLRRDIARYLYRTAIRQQYALSHTGRTRYVSAGHDRHAGNLTGQYGRRSTLRAHQQMPLTAKLELRTGLYLSSRLEHRGGNNGTAAYDPNERNAYPYAQLADGQGNPLPLYLQHRRSFVEEAPAHGLLDWQYKPLERLHDETQDHHVGHLVGNASLRYHLNRHWEAAVHYQAEGQQTRITDHRLATSYYVRNLVNEFTQTDATGAVAHRPVPVGDISDRQRGTLHTHQTRAVVHYRRRGAHHDLQAQAGMETRHLADRYSLERTYQPGGRQPIADPLLHTVRTDQFRSAFLLADYRYRDRFLLSASIRTDHARLYGLAANQTGAPFWSAGAGWIGKHIRLRASYGTQGNIARQAYAATTTQAYVHAPGSPDPALQWENNRTLNAGAQFRAASGRLSGSVTLYHRHSHNLLGETPENDRSGLANNAGLRTIGAEMSVSYRTIRPAAFRWQTHIIFSGNRTAVSRYRDPTGLMARHIDPATGRRVQPVEGRPVFSLYSLPWRGLDSRTGDPTGLLDGTVSRDWKAMYEQTPLDGMVFHGSAVPTAFGSLRQQFTYRNLQLSVLFSSRLGYYFRKSALSYVDLLLYWNGHGDYARRWRRPGDEQYTHVPSLQLQPAVHRDNFYRLSSVHVLKGDHIRLEDITLTYRLSDRSLPAGAIRSLELYTCLEQVAVLWKANRAGIDPYYHQLPAERSRCTIGLTANF